MDGRRMFGGAESIQDVEGGGTHAVCSHEETSPQQPRRVAAAAAAAAAAVVQMGTELQQLHSELIGSV